MPNIRYLALLAIFSFTILVTGCAGNPPVKFAHSARVVQTTKPRVAAAPPAIGDTPQAIATPLPDGSVGSATASSPAAPAQPAVVALLGEADQAAHSGDIDGAAATLERGIRINPRSAELWERLAEVRLAQRQPALAEELAKKSNLLAGGNPELQRKNWSIIAKARKLRGDSAGAREAEAKASR